MQAGWTTLVNRINQTIVVPVTGPELGLVNRFYRANGHKGKCGRDDRVFVLKSEGTGTSSVIHAAIRYTAKPKPESSDQHYWLLRGLWVEGNSLRQGLGGQLLEESLKGFREPVWCYPYEHLIRFYQNHGFLSVDPGQAPENIASSWQAYQRRGEDFGLMVYFSIFNVSLSLILNR